jgi:hypothetical protein
MGVMDKPFGIDLDGERLMELSKGQYTMLKLRAGKYDMVVTNTTVEGPTNSMGEATRSFVLELRGTDAVYLMFKHEPTSFWGRFSDALGDQVKAGTQKLVADATTVTIPVGDRVTLKFYDSKLQNPTESEPRRGIGCVVESVTRGTAKDAAVELDPVEGAQDSPLH